MLVVVHVLRTEDTVDEEAKSWEEGEMKPPAAGADDVIFWLVVVVDIHSDLHS